MFAGSHFRSFWAFLILGVILRCAALNQPLVDAHLLRQCQTAAATRDLMQQPGLAVSTRLPWIGDSESQYVLEFPLFNYLVIGVHALARNLELSGKLTSIILWAASFWLLQAVWRRMLDDEQAFWANLLFVLSPLEIFYGQAFMPEMLVQVAAFGFLVLMLRYVENPSLPRWLAAVGCGLVALLLKFPAVAHLYLVLAVLLFRREGWRGAIRPRYVGAAIVTVVCLKLWSGYADAINTHPLSFGGSKENLRVFIGTFGDRLQLKLWITIVLCLGAFVVPGPALIAAGYGFLNVIRRCGTHLILTCWLAALVVYYLLWFGNGPSKQSYYNLAAVAPLAALGGIGIVALFKRERVARWGRPFAAAFAVLLVAFVIPICLYLFQQDRRILAASLWARDHLRPEEVFVFRALHRWDMVDYPCNPVPAFYSNRQTFVWTRGTPDNVKASDLQKAAAVVITLPPEEESAFGVINRRIRGLAKPAPENFEWLAAEGFREVAREGGFVVYQKNAR